MKKLAFFLGMLALAFLILFGAAYAFARNRLPPLGTSYDYERQFRSQIEGSRTAINVGVPVPERPTKFEKPELGAIPKDFVNMYLTEHGCAGYFQSPREDGLVWLRRVLLAAIEAAPPRGSGRCELTFAAHLAGRLGVRGAVDLAVAADLVHSALAKDEVLAWEIATAPVDEGIYGAKEAAQVLFKSKLETMTLGQLAELQLALHPYDFFLTILRCQGTQQIRLARDQVLNHLLSAGHISKEQKDTAANEPLLCEKTR